MFKKLVNFALFYVGWLVTVYGAARGQLWLGPVVMALIFLIHIVFSPCKKSDLILALICVGLGVTFESLWSQMGLVIYAGYEARFIIAPLWILALWLNFSMAINHSLAWLKSHYLLAGILGAIFAPISYYGGLQMGAAQTNSYGLFLCVEALLWSMVIPFLFFCAKKLDLP